MKYNHPDPSKSVVDNFEHSLQLNVARLDSTVTLKQCPIKSNNSLSNTAPGAANDAAQAPNPKDRSVASPTKRVRDDVVHLRNRPCFAALKRAFFAANRWREFRLVHFSIQGNHVHFIVEAYGARELARGMQGLNVRMAIALNRLMRTWLLREGPKRVGSAGEPVSIVMEYVVDFGVTKRR